MKRITGKRLRRYPVNKMNSRQRFVSCMTFQPVDRCFFKEDNFSPSTIRRWEKEGLPEGCNPNEYFGMDLREFIRVNMDCFPGFEERIIEEDGDNIIKIDSGGRRVKQRRDNPLDAMPQFLDWPVKCRDDFERIKEQYQSDIQERYPADYEEKKDFWNNTCTSPVAYELRGMFFHRLHMWMGLEGLCMAMYDDPDWVHEMVEFLERFLITVSEKVLSEINLDYVYGCDDIAYKTSSLISPGQFKKFFFEPTRRVVEKVKEAGVPVIVMDTDGNLDEFAQIYLDAGFNAICPIEVAAGNDLLKLRERFGKKLALQGGFDKRILTEDKGAIHKEVMRLYPRMMTEGGFCPTIDHAVPENVSFDNYRYYIELTKQVAENPQQYLNNTL